MTAATTNTADLPVCVIGAGSSGLVMAKALLARGVAFEVFEKGSDLGGMWRYENDSGVSSAYRSLHIDTSRKSLGYPDFPIPETLPDFLSHTQVLGYFEAYAEHFKLRAHIRFRTEVTQVEPVGDGRWRVTLEGGEHRHYRAVLVATGTSGRRGWRASPAVSMASRCTRTTTAPPRRSKAKTCS